MANVIAVHALTTVVWSWEPGNRSHGVGPALSMPGEDHYADWLQAVLEGECPGCSKEKCDHGTRLQRGAPCLDPLADSMADPFIEWGRCGCDCLWLVATYDQDQLKKAVAWWHFNGRGEPARIPF